MGAGTSLANAEYLQSLFGVSAVQAAASGCRADAPGAGVRDGRLSLSLTCMASPLVRKKRSVQGLLAAVYAF
jgi:outer membrane scaffolding protein for murein synthesis (MipA/OmpV family)